MYGKKIKYRKVDKTMVKESVRIENESGIHARPATEISKTAMQFKCNVDLIVDGKKVNAKSPIMIMAAGIKSNTKLEIACDGEDEEKALEEIKKVFENQFGK